MLPIIHRHIPITCYRRFTSQEYELMESQQLQKDGFFHSFNLLVTAKSDNLNQDHLNGGAAIILDLYGNEREVMGRVTATERNCICGISQSSCCTSGLQSRAFKSSDYIAISSPDRTLISTLDLQKSQRLAQCHTQEIVTALASDNSGHYLFSGSKTGNCSIWDTSSGELLVTPRLHLHAITKMSITSDNIFLISSSRDGMLKIWFLSSMFDSNCEEVAPFR